MATPAVIYAFIVKYDCFHLRQIIDSRRECVLRQVVQGLQTDYVAQCLLSNMYCAPAAATPDPIQIKIQGLAISERPGQKLFFCLRYSWNSAYLVGSSLE